MSEEQWRNRTVGDGEEDPEQLLANPRNWKVHPKHQQEALKGVLSDVGWVQAIVVNKTTGFVLDGHARVALALQTGQKSVPVKYVELNEQEEALVLTVLDPLAALAVTDNAKLEELLRDVRTGDAALQQMITDLASKQGLNWGDTSSASADGGGGEFPRYSDDTKTQHTCPKCGYEWNGDG